MSKSPDAFRTISEVAEALDTPAHVLRFWETRFPQIRPVKRAGGRRYYRPSDLALLAGIRRLLHDQGMTIRGVQKLLREQGIRYVAEQAGIGPEGLYEPDLSAIAAYAGDVPPLSPEGEIDADAYDDEIRRERPDAGPPVAMGLHQPAPDTDAGADATPPAEPAPSATPAGAEVISFPGDQSRAPALDEAAEDPAPQQAIMPGLTPAGADEEGPELIEADQDSGNPDAAPGPELTEAAEVAARAEPETAAAAETTPEPEPEADSLPDPAAPAMPAEEDEEIEAPFAFDVEAETDMAGPAEVTPLFRPHSRPEASLPQQSTLAARLRAIPPGQLSAQREELQAYSALIRELQQRLTRSQQSL
ncbi:MerR family transcriptional regulator [Pseudogemmobacter faecipullorum]|uniref:MerR family transcriptional regulator n=1 Tax=Pseudogemmobacter faecipullorum TaxID=2755041 RepID=UPI001D03069B|nr:MerR family transcriptional regulator [Pseudogemmobacter faecipullorum]